MENTLSILFKSLGVFILTGIIALGVTAVNQNGRHAAIDLSAKSVLSDEDYKEFKDLETANKKSMENLRNSDGVQQGLRMHRKIEADRNWSMGRR